MVSQKWSVQNGYYTNLAVLLVHKNDDQSFFSYLMG